MFTTGETTEPKLILAGDFEIFTVLSVIVYEPAIAGLGGRTFNSSVISAIIPLKTLLMTVRVD